VRAFARIGLPGERQATDQQHGDDDAPHSAAPHDPHSARPKLHPLRVNLSGGRSSPISKRTQTTLLPLGQQHACPSHPGHSAQTSARPIERASFRGGWPDGRNTSIRSYDREVGRSGRWTLEEEGSALRLRSFAEQEGSVCVCLRAVSQEGRHHARHGREAVRWLACGQVFGILPPKPSPMNHTVLAPDTRKPDPRNANS
jgi:hypothetical protein